MTRGTRLELRLAWRLVLIGALACQSPPGAPSAGHDDAAAAADAAALPYDAGPATADAAPSDAATGVDLFVNAPRAIADLAVETQVFSSGDCELSPEEMCVPAPGARRLLRFAVETPNIGTEDLELGVPSPRNGNFVWSSCHQHWHFDGYARYGLVDAAGNEVAQGRKQAFCLIDSSPFTVDAPALDPGERYNCASQGIHAGWSDVYTASLPCQYIDVTGVPDGDYQLTIELDTREALPDQRRNNNRAAIPVTLGDPRLAKPTEPCPEGLGAHATTGTHRECDWTLATTVECVAGHLLDIACSDSCDNGPGGRCTGDPMLRACDAAAPTSNCTSTSALAAHDDGCSGPCPFLDNIVCPASGRVAVYSASSTLGEAYTCELAVDSIAENQP